MTGTGLAEWIAVDWGTTHLRAWAMQGASAVDRADSQDGMATLDQHGFEPALLRLIAPWLGRERTPVLACGMVGARQGWVDAGYAQVPAKPLAARSVRAATVDAPLDVHIIPGLSQVTPPDVMRGEETQIAGFLSLNPNWDGVVCLPGTHSKWALVSADEVVSFQTFMTGELFAALSRHTVLRHSVATDGWDDDAFAASVADMMSNPERLAARLFGLRASDLLEGADASVTRARLSGLLIGAELAAARPYWLGQQLAVIGDGGAARAYATALGLQGVLVTVADAERMTLAGLTLAWRKLKENA